MAKKQSKKQHLKSVPPSLIEQKEIPVIGADYMLDKMPRGKYKAVIILGLGKAGELSEICHSTMTVDELGFLATQFNAHIANYFGRMQPTFIPSPESK